MQSVHRSGSKKRYSAASARYDYFETKATIDGKPYVVAFDVEVIPGKNNYRTHKVLNEINLTPIPSAEPGPVPGAQGKKSGLRGDVPSLKTNIPQNGSEINTEKQTQFDSTAEEANQSAVYGRFFSFSLLLLLLFTILYGKINYL